LQWLHDRGLNAAKTPRWFVEIEVPTNVEGSRIEINIYPEEWGFVFRYGARVSSIRVTDVVFAHGRDDYQLAGKTPSLDHLGELLRAIEESHHVVFERNQPTIRSNLARALPVVRGWLAALP
jgi:hypothetical protein